MITFINFIFTSSINILPFVCSGCDINSPRKPGPGGRGGEESKDQSSPLHLCCHWGLQSVVQTLLEHGANVNAWVNKILCLIIHILN